MSGLPHHRTPCNASGAMIPAFLMLADEPIWLPWREVDRGNGKRGKPPVVPATGRGNGWQEPTAAVTYGEAIAYAATHGLAGVGIVMGPRTRQLGLVGIDLDGAITDKGTAEWAKPVLMSLGSLESYTERSPSGKGFRILALGIGEAQGSDVEVYDGTGARFLTITGNRKPAWPDRIAAAETTIGAALERAAAHPKRSSQGEATAPAASSAAPQAAVPPLADLSRETLRSALAAVPVAEMSYGEWIKVGQAIHHQTGGDEDGAELWHDWSSLDDGRYDPEVCADKWASFGKPRKGAPVTAKHILKLAQARGWRQPQSDPTSALGATEDADSWPAPGNLGGGGAASLAPESWIAGTLPPALESYTANVAARIGADDTAVRGMMLPMMGALAPAAISYQPRGDAGWSVPLTFYAALVGPPGSVKTPIISSLAKPVEQAEADWRKEHKAADARHKRESTRAKAEDAPAMPYARPKLRRRTTTSATIEGHARLVERTGEAIVTLVDELQSFLGGLDKFTGVGATGSGDRPYWLSAYEGKPYHSDRADEAKCISVASVKASVLGGVQPRVLGAVLMVLTSDGLAQRFMWVPTGTARMSEDVKPDDDGAALYTAACRLILDAAERDLGGPVVLTADSDAKAVSFDAERFGIEAAATLPPDDPLRDIAAKSRGFVARLTAALHVIEWAVRQADDLALGLIDTAEPLPLTVPGTTAAAALRVWQSYYWRAAVRTYRGATEAATARDVADLAEFVRHLDAAKASFTATEAGTAIHRFREKGRPLLDAAARTLERAHWLRRRKQTGGTSWTVNPALRAEA